MHTSKLIKIITLEIFSAKRLTTRNFLCPCKYQVIDIQSYPGYAYPGYAYPGYAYLGYPYLGYPKPRLSECSSERGVCSKMVFLLKSQTLQLSRVHVLVCHTYMFNVGTQWYVIVYSVKCKGLQTRPSCIFLCYLVCTGM